MTCLTGVASYLRRLSCNFLFITGSARLLPPESSNRYAPKTPFRGFFLVLLLCAPFYLIAKNKEENLTRQQLNHLASDYEQALWEYNPELGTYYGAKVALDKFKDHSLQALYAWHKKEDIFLEKLNTLNEKELLGFPEHQTFLLLKQLLTDNKAVRICQEELWNASPQDGWQTQLTMLAEKQPVGTDKNRKLALKRWRTACVVIDNEIDNLKVGLKAGYTAPKPAVTRLIAQLKTMLDAPIKDSPFFDFAKRDGDPHFKSQVEYLIKNEINPAISRYVQFLEKDYLPVARNEIGLSALPNGKAMYAAKIQKETTLVISPQEIFQFGIKHMEQLEKEIGEIGLRLFKIEQMEVIFNQAKSSPFLRFKSEQEILAYNQAALNRAIQTTPAWFRTIPKAACVIKPYAFHMAKSGAPGEYHPPTIDGIHPGIFYINTYQPKNINRLDQEATLFHELIPGHHFHTALLYEDKIQHPLNKYIGNAAFDEGWALYVERLADEMGLYSSDVSRLGMLSNEALRTARLVIDPGIHVMGWTREQAIDYLRCHTTLDEDMITAEVDRYIMSPAQATSYMLGKREIDNLRSMAENQLKEKFDIRDFHSEVLKNGASTLSMLKAHIEEWVKQVKEQ